MGRKTLIEVIGWFSVWTLISIGAIAPYKWMNFTEQTLSQYCTPKTQIVEKGESYWSNAKPILDGINEVRQNLPQSESYFERTMNQIRLNSIGRAEIVKFLQRRNNNKPLIEGGEIETYSCPYSEIASTSNQ